VYSALQTRLIDGAENNIKSFDSSRHYEIAGYWSETRHSFAPEALVMSRQRFDTLSAADRELLFATVRESVPHMRGLWDQAEAKSRAAVLAAGVKFNAVDLTAFHRAAEPLRARQLELPASRQLFELIRAVA
jgi:TRAP-type C4-dicarboxylate transport system substrate-binding protein